MKRPLLLPVLALLFLTFSRLSCPEDCEAYVDVPVRISGITTQALDNRKEEPMVLAAGAPGYLNAFGFRMMMEFTLVDSLDWRYRECSKDSLYAPIVACRIFSMTPLPGGNGLDVSQLFRYVDRSGNVLRYATLPENAATQIMRDREASETRRFDFLLVQPPANEGLYQFELQLIMKDSSVVSTLTEPVYLK